MENLISSINKYNSITGNITVLEAYVPNTHLYTITTSYNFFDNEEIEIQLTLGNNIRANLVKSKNGNTKYLKLKENIVVGSFSQNQLLTIRVPWRINKQNEFVSLNDIFSGNQTLKTMYDARTIKYLGSNRLITPMEVESIVNSKTNYYSGTSLSNQQNILGIVEFEMNQNGQLLNQISPLDVDVYLTNEYYSAKYNLIIDNISDVETTYRFQVKQEYFNVSNKINNNVMYWRNNLTNTFTFKIIDVNASTTKKLLVIECTQYVNTTNLINVTSNVYLGVGNTHIIRQNTNDGNLSTLKYLQHNVEDFNVTNTQTLNTFLFYFGVNGYSNYGDLLNGAVGQSMSNPQIFSSTTPFDFNSDLEYGIYNIQSTTVTNSPVTFDGSFIVEVLNLRKIVNWFAQSISSKQFIQKVHGKILQNSVLVPFVAYRYGQINSSGSTFSPWSVMANTNHTHLATDITETANRKFVTAAQQTLLNQLLISIWKPIPAPTVADLTLLYPTPIVGTMVFVTAVLEYYWWNGTAWVTFNYPVANGTNTGVVNPELYYMFKGIGKQINSKINSFGHQLTLDTVYGTGFQYKSDNTIDLSYNTTDYTSLQQEYMIALGFNVMLFGNTDKSIGIGNNINSDSRTVSFGIDLTTTDSDNSINIGYSNNITDNPDSLILGTGINLSYNLPIILGHYPDLSVNNNYQFLIGNGNNTQAKNILSIDSQDKLRIHGTQAGLILEGKDNTHVVLAGGSTTTLSAITGINVKQLDNIRIETGILKILMTYSDNSTGSVDFPIINLMVTDYFNNITGAINGVNKIFTTSRDFVGGTIKVYKGGLRMTNGPTSDYIELSNNQIEFTVAPLPNEILLFEYFPLDT